MSPLLTRLQNIAGQCKRARESQVLHAERMVKISRADLKVGEFGDNIAISIPTVLTSREDPGNILGVMVDRV